MIGPTRLRSIDPLPGRRLAVVWDSGEGMTVDFDATITRGGVFAPLADEALFRAARIGERQRTVEWPEPHDDDGEPIIDIDAESLFLMALEQVPVAKSA